MMPSRRSHTKSHHGCRQCKARRVKCDETAPQCQRCVKRHIACSFLEDSTDAFPTPPATSTFVDHHTPNPNGFPTPDVSAQRFELVLPRQPEVASFTPPPSIGPTFNLLDIELIHHYCTRTYITASSRLTTHVIFRDAVFNEGLRYEFLMHAMMATAALHKATLQPRSSATYEEYAKVALSHQNAALAGYIPAVTKPNAQNSIALFSVSLLLTIWAFASKDLPESLKSAGMSLTSLVGDPDVKLPVGSPILQFIEIIMILRGIYSIIQETGQWLQGDIEEMLRYPRTEDLPPHPQDVEEAYDLLAESVRSYDGDQMTKDMCVNQITRLQDISRCRSVVEWDGHVFSFFIMAPPAFLNSIKQGNPMALAIFAYWAACFRCMDHHWWANGWAQTLVHDVCNRIDVNNWARVMEWPRRQCGFQESNMYEVRRGP